MSKESLVIIKKTGRRDGFDRGKIEYAAQCARHRLGKQFSDDEVDEIVEKVLKSIEKDGEMEIPVSKMHGYVEAAIRDIDPECADQYKAYRNYKVDMKEIMAEAMAESEELSYGADHSNANSDSDLISTKRSLKYKAYNKGVYKRFFLNEEERQAVSDGYIYVHDIGDRLDTMNCCLFDMGAVLHGGFDMENMHYNEPNSVSAALNVICDVMQMAGSQQYGGFTVPEIDTILEPYCEKSYKTYCDEYACIMAEAGGKNDPELRKSYALRKIKRDLQQGFQSMEYNLNTVASSRGDFIFTTITFGLDERPLAQMVSETILEVRAAGQGKKGHKVPAIFPKLSFLYDEDLHGEGGKLEGLFKKAIYCSSRAQYPDYLSLTGDGYKCEIYKKYKNGVPRWYLGDDNKVKEDPNWVDNVISGMGCRAYLSVYYERGGFKPADENDKPVFTGRWNGGAISMNVPMILRKAQVEGKDFFEVLEYYLQLARGIHKRTKKYLSKIKASSNPLCWTQGGHHWGHLQPDDPIEPLLDYVTFSYGYVGLNEAQMLYNGKTLNEDDDFAYSVLKYINDFANSHKEEDHILWAIYGTPAESVAYTQRDQFVKKYGIVGDVGKRAYWTNSFHSPVWEEVNHFDKMDREYRFFHISNGGHIIYTRIPTSENLEGIAEEVRYAMKKGFYFGVNQAKSYCGEPECGYEWDDDKQDYCPHCGSENITSISRVCGYLSLTRAASNNPRQRTRMAEGKLAEIRERKVM